MILGFVDEYKSWHLLKETLMKKAVKRDSLTKFWCPSLIKMDKEFRKYIVVVLVKRK
jgi:hypothetical protein